MSFFSSHIFSLKTSKKSFCYIKHLYTVFLSANISFSFVFVCYYIQKCERNVINADYKNLKGKEKINSENKIVKTENMNKNKICEGK